MRRLSDDIMNHFLNGEHTVSFQPGLANAIPQDNDIESSYIHIVMGRLAHKAVNVENLVQLVLESLNTYENLLPEYYYKPLVRDVTMTVKRKKTVSKK